MHSDFVVDDDESMSESEDAEPAAALFARQQMGLSRPQSVAALDKHPAAADVEPNSDEEAMADEAMEAAQANEADIVQAMADEDAAAAAGPPEPPEDHLVMPMDGEDEHADGQNALYDGVAAADAGAFDDLQGIIATQEIENLFDPNNSQN